MCDILEGVVMTTKGRRREGSAMTARIEIPKDLLDEFCRRRRIRKLSLFGSVLREDFGPQSDVDVLVEFEPDAVAGYFELADIEMELTELLGRKVDLRTPLELSRYFRQEVLASAETQYVSR
jgi:uncharacterized protein